MTYWNPIGVVTLPQGRGFDRNAFKSFIRDCNMKCAVVLDDLTLCAELNIPYPVHRSYTFEPNPGSNPLEAAKQAVEYIASTPFYSSVYWQINNEPDVTLTRFEMYAYMIAEIARLKLPIKCVFGNFSSGSVKCGQGSDENEWLTKGKSFLEALVRFPQHLIGVHEYTSYLPWYVSDGGKYMTETTWKNRPTKVNWELPQWHLGRNVQGIAAACAALKINLPKLIITEALIDRMNDLPFLKTHPELNGYKTYADIWSIQFPEHSLGELYSEFLIWAWETIYADAPVPVEGITTFCYGNTGKWENYNVADDKDYLDGMREYRYAPLEAEVEVLPDLSHYYLAKLTKLPQDFVNMREEPNVLSKVAHILLKGDLVTYYPNSVTNGWVRIMSSDDVSGWVSLQNGAVEFTFYENPTPPVETVTIPKETLQKIAATLHSDIESLQYSYDLLKDLL